MQFLYFIQFTSNTHVANGEIFIIEKLIVTGFSNIIGVKKIRFGAAFIPISYFIKGRNTTHTHEFLTFNILLHVKNSDTKL